LLARRGTTAILGKSGFRRRPLPHHQRSLTGVLSFDPEVLIRTPSATKHSWARSVPQRVRD
jgi:hypothetical protein